MTKIWRIANAVSALLAACLCIQAQAACSCRIPSTEENYSNAELVLSARMTAVKYGADQASGRRTQSISLRTTEVFKGDPPKTMTVENLHPCGLYLPENMDVLVFLDRSRAVSFCSGSLPVVKGEQLKAYWKFADPAIQDSLVNLDRIFGELRAFKVKKKQGEGSVHINVEKP